MMYSNADIGVAIASNAIPEAFGLYRAQVWVEGWIQGLGVGKEAVPAVLREYEGSDVVVKTIGEGFCGLVDGKILLSGPGACKCEGQKDIEVCHDCAQSIGQAVGEGVVGARKLVVHVTDLDHPGLDTAGGPERLD